MRSFQCTRSCRFGVAPPENLVEVVEAHHPIRVAQPARGGRKVILLPVRLLVAERPGRADIQHHPGPWKSPGNPGGFSALVWRWPGQWWQPLLPRLAVLVVAPMPAGWVSRAILGRGSGLSRIHCSASCQQIKKEEQNCQSFMHIAVAFNSFIDGISASTGRLRRAGRHP